MRQIDKIYIGGQFVSPRGEQHAPLFNPATEEQIGTVRLGNAEDVNDAVAAARLAFPLMARTSVEERIDMLERLSRVVAVRANDVGQAMRVEYGSPPEFTRFTMGHMSTVFASMAEVVRSYPFCRPVGNADVTREPLGVVGAITPWNSNAGFICTKLAAAIGSGSPVVIKPSELSAIQIQVIAEALHAADLPAGVLNIVNGYGQIAGAALAAHPDVAKMTFTGSALAGQSIMRAAAETFKRVTLELGGKCATIILEDADVEVAVRSALRFGFTNSGQACIAGTRILAPCSRLNNILELLRKRISEIVIGGADHPSSQIGALVSARHWERVQSYIRLGQEEGVTLLAGGEGRPKGIGHGASRVRPRQCRL